MLFIHMLASFGIAVLSGMGVGSAGLFVLYLTAFAGLSQLQAQGLTLVFFLLSAHAICVRIFPELSWQALYG